MFVERSRLGVKKDVFLVEAFLWLIWFIHGLSLLSNSYIMAEGRMLGFWIASIVTLMTCACCMEDVQTTPRINVGGMKAQGRLSACYVLWISNDGFF